MPALLIALENLLVGSAVPTKFEFCGYNYSDKREKCTALCNNYNLQGSLQRQSHGWHTAVIYPRGHELL